MMPDKAECDPVDLGMVKSALLSLQSEDCHGCMGLCVPQLSVPPLMQSYELQLTFTLALHLWTDAAAACMAPQLHCFAGRYSLFLTVYIMKVGQHRSLFTAQWGPIAPYGTLLFLCPSSYYQVSLEYHEATISVGP